MRPVTFGANSAQAARSRPAVKPTSMIASFTEWLHDHIFYTGVVGIVESVLGILAFGGVLSVVFGSPTIKAAAVVAAVLGVLGLFVLLVANRTEWRRRSDQDRRLIRHYCDELKERYQHAWTITSWTCVTTIAPNGDTQLVITCTAVVECELLDFFSIWDGPNWDGWPDRFRRRVRIKVRRHSGNPNGGTRPDVTSTWMARNRIEILMHLGQPARRGDTIGMVAEIDWPARCLPFAKGESCEEFVQKFATPVQFARNTIVLPKGYEACFEIIGLVEGVDDFTLTSEPNNSGQLETTLVTRDIEGNRRVGLRLDLR
jgi:hypothetical protein